MFQNSRIDTNIGKQINVIPFTINYDFFSEHLSEQSFVFPSETAISSYDDVTNIWVNKQRSKDALDTY